jgi:transketolase
MTIQATREAQTTPEGGSKIDTLCINTIRTLCIDAVQKANSGHPGTAMAMAPVIYDLWQRHLRFDPSDPIWPNRDRFVLSAGHASMLLYSVLHLTRTSAVDPEYEILGRPSVTIEDIRSFRQLGSRCAGHPEYHWTSGIETTTGPLGQGLATSLGMAIASKWLGSRYNPPESALFDYRVYALCGDGCMMEGISSEAASLAGHLKLNNLCWIYDNNHITIEGNTALAFTEDVAARFAAYRWNVIRVHDANNLSLLDEAFSEFHDTPDRPTLIIVDSHIGYGSPNRQDTSGAHGEPLGEEEVRLTKLNYGWPADRFFYVPDGVYEHFQSGVASRGRELREEWETKFANYKKSQPQLALEIEQIQRRDLPSGWDRSLPVFPPDAKGLAGRDSSAKVLNAIAENLPWMIGGSADLSPSTKTRLTFAGAGDFEAGNYGGRNLHFGIREHAMGAVLNGLSLSKLRCFGSGFLIFSDYGRGSLRLSAIMELPVIYIFTHDSIGVGEDGPTHQPIEQLVSLRAIPNLMVMRPGDANETVEAWRTIVQLRHQPVALILSRQPSPTLDRTRYAPASGVAKGGYILAGPEGSMPDVVLIGTGSEVALCIDAYEKLRAEGIRARVVSMPSWELFEQQPEAYKDSVLPPSLKARVTVEQSSALGWERYAGSEGAILGMRTFGASAPLKVLQKEFGFTLENIVAAARDQIKRNG